MMLSMEKKLSASSFNAIIVRYHQQPDERWKLEVTPVQAEIIENIEKIVADLEAKVFSYR